MTRIRMELGVGAHQHVLAVTAAKLRGVIVSWILITNLGGKGVNEAVGDSAPECN